MITWFGWTWHFKQGLFMEHSSFEFWILVGFESWWCALGLPKEKRFGEEERFDSYTLLGKVGGAIGIL
jgi:hypothetical protein